MTLDDLITETRVEVDDNVEPYRCSDEKFKAFANEAEREAARRARLFIDTSTAAICTATVTASQTTVTLDSRVLFVRRVKLAGRALTLRRKVMREMDLEAPGWETTTGQPSHYITDFASQKLRLYPIPTTTGVLTLTVVRLPLVDMTLNASTPEIRSHLHSALKHWMRALFYRLPDTQIRDPKAAMEAEAEFEREFGKKSSAQDEDWIAREIDQDADTGVY